MSPTPKPRSRIPSSVYKMAIFTAVTVLVIGVLATLIGNISFAPTRSYSALFSDAAGVYAGDRVRLSGVEVGTVTSIDLVQVGDQHLAKLTFAVDNTVPVFRSAKIELRFENVVGQRYLSIDEKPDAGPTMPTGATFPLSQTVPALNLTVLFNGFQPLFRALSPTDTNRLSYELVRALQGDSATFASLMRSTAQLTDALANKDAVVGQVIDSLNAVLGTVDQRDTELTGLIVQFRNLMTGLSADRTQIDSSLPSLASLLTNAQGFLIEVRSPLARNIKALNIRASGLADTRGTLAAILNRLPNRFRAMDRAGSYASLFNFYVCGLMVSVQLPAGTAVLSGPAVQANEKDTVCGGGEG